MAVLTCAHHSMPKINSNSFFAAHLLQSGFVIHLFNPLGKRSLFPCQVGLRHRLDLGLSCKGLLLLLQAEEIFCIDTAAEKDK